MWQKERHQRISSLLESLGQVTKEQLTEELGVSRETVRRDLLEMEKLGLVNCVHGGVTAVSSGKEPPLNERARLRMKEKRAIAQEARKLVKQGDTLFIDSGSTTTQLARELSAIHDLHIVTNSVEVASIIGNANETSLSGNAVTLLGGRLGRYAAATQGDITIREINRYHVDYAMVSPVAMHPKYGAMSYEPEEAEIARAMTENASRTIVLADYSKFQSIGRISYCPLEQIDKLIVDTAANASITFKSIQHRVGKVCIAG